MVANCMAKGRGQFHDTHRTHTLLAASLATVEHSTKDRCPLLQNSSYNEYHQ